MAWSDVLTVYHAHLVAAGAAVTPAITSVARGEPKVLAKVPHIAYWWSGIRESTTGGNTLTRVNQEEGLVTTIYVPDSIRLPNQMDTIEDYLREITFQIHDRLWGDTHLGENSIAIGEDTKITATGWAVVSDIIARTATFTCWVDLAEVHVIVN